KDKDKDKDKEKDKATAPASPTAKPNDKASPGDKKTDTKAKPPVVVKVDLDGIQNRIVGLDIPQGNYTNLRLVDDRIFYQRRTVGDDKGGDDDDGPNGDRVWHLCSYSLEDRK